MITQGLSGLTQTAIAAMLITTGSGGIASANDAEADFFRGKTITITVGTAAGGSYDIIARLIARHLDSQIPGKPTIVVRNMPGAGHLLATNYLYNKAARDGTELGVVNQAMPIEQLLQTDNVSYDVARFNWIGRVAPSVETSVMWHTSPTKTVYDAMKRETVVGGTAPTSSEVFVPWLLNNLAGTKFKVVTGYQGATGAQLAMERGEVEGTGIPLDSVKVRHPEWLTDRKINVIVQYTTARNPEIADVPTMVELGKTEEARQILGLFASGAAIGRSMMAPPNLPPERVATLRQAFQQMVRNEAFLAEADKMKAFVNPLTGEMLQALVRDIIAKFPTELVDKARAARRQPG